MVHFMYRLDFNVIIDDVLQFHIALASFTASLSLLKMLLDSGHRKALHKTVRYFKSVQNKTLFKRPVCRQIETEENLIKVR